MVLRLLVAKHLLRGVEQTVDIDPKHNRYWCIYQCGNHRRHRWARNHVEICQFNFLDASIAMTP